MSPAALASRAQHISFILLIAAAISLAPVGANAQAQQTPVPEKPSVAPQIDLSGTGIATLEGHFPRFTLPSGNRSSTSRINVSDSAILLGASQRLSRGGIGSFVLGGTSTESDRSPSGTDIFLHQLFVNYQTRSLEATLGRTDVATRLIEFPTIRGDDLNEFVNVLNPFSDGDNVEEHRYSDQASVSLSRNLQHFVNVHAQHLVTSTPATLGQSGLNSFGVRYLFQSLPAVEALTKVPLWGVGFERQTIGKGFGGANNLVYGGLVYNIQPDPVDLIDLRVQDIYSLGNDTTTIGTVTDTFRAANNTLAASLRYLHSPFGVPGYQVALTVGYKNYTKVSNANTLGLALTGVKRLGDGFDLVAQYAYQRRDAAYASAFSGVRDEHSVQVGFIFNFNNTFNQHLGPRRSLLNLQHKYVPD